MSMTPATVGAPTMASSSPATLALTLDAAMPLDMPLGLDAGVLAGSPRIGVASA